MDSVPASATPDLVRFHEEEVTLSGGKDGMGEVAIAMEILTRVDLELVYLSEKLVTLEMLLMAARENDDLGVISDSEKCVQKSFELDLLCGVLLDYEINELDRCMDSVQIALVRARQNVSSSAGELFTVMEAKLQDSDESLKLSLRRFLDFKMQLAKLQMPSFNHNSNYDFQVPRKPKVHVSRMVEKSLARELDLVKKLTGSKQNEEDLKLKLRLTQHVAFCMEETAEVVRGRFLEAENAAEVLMGIAKDLVAHHQIIQFNLNACNRNDEDLKSRLADCTEQLSTKEASIRMLNERIVELVAGNSTVSMLQEKVTLLEEEIKKSESKLNKANAVNEEMHQQLKEVNDRMESLKETYYAAENRAQIAEEKVSQLAATNMELTEELGFLKASHESSTKKLSVLEKQSRDLELQLQHAKASSEAGQEQQNMLYSAIWDMETLIDELKQKVSSAEIKTENAEEQYLLLSDTNLQLRNELDFLRSRVESVETSLSQADVEKIASAKDINIKTNLIMDLVMQLATERQRIKKQIYSLTEEKRTLMETLQKRNDNVSASLKNFSMPNHNIAKIICAETLAEVLTDSSSKCLQVEELLEDRHANGTELDSSICVNEILDLETNLEAEGVVKATWPKRRTCITAVIVLAVSVLAAHVVKWRSTSFEQFTFTLPAAVDLL